jgi:hypothetical protein
MWMMMMMSREYPIGPMQDYWPIERERTLDIRFDAPSVATPSNIHRCVIIIVVVAAASVTSFVHFKRDIIVIR